MSAFARANVQRISRLRQGQATERIISTGNPPGTGYLEDVLPRLNWQTIPKFSKSRSLPGGLSEETSFNTQSSILRAGPLSFKDGITILVAAQPTGRLFDFPPGRAQPPVAPCRAVSSHGSAIEGEIPQETAPGSRPAGGLLFPEQAFSEVDVDYTCATCAQAEGSAPAMSITARPGQLQLINRLHNARKAKLKSK